MPKSLDWGTNDTPRSGLTLIGRGRTAEVFAWGEGKILKLFYAHLPPESIKKEFEISANVHGLGISVPRPYELITFEGRDGIVFECVLGKSMLRTMATKPWRAKHYLRELARLQYAIHQKRATGVGLSQKEELEERIKSAPKLSEGERDRIICYLDTLGDGDRLCHGDFHPDNIILGKQTWVIDWMNATIGNPAADVARTVILLTSGALPDRLPRLLEWVINTMRQRLNQTYISEYSRLANLSYSEIDSWILPVAAARLGEGLPSEEQQTLLELVRSKFEITRNSRIKDGVKE